MVDLAEVSAGDVITATRANLVKDYVQDGTHKVNTLSIDIGGTVFADSSLNLSNVGTISCGAITSSGNLDIGANSFTVNSVEIVGSDGEVNAAAIEDSFLRNDGDDTTTGRVTAQGGFACTVDDTDNFVAISLTNNDITNDPDTLSITNSGTGKAIYVDQDGNTGTSGAVEIDNTGNTGVGLRVYSNIAGTVSNPLAEFVADNSSFDENVVEINNDGTGWGLELNSNATNSWIGKGIMINHNATNHDVVAGDGFLLTVSAHFIVNDAGSHTASDIPIIFSGSFTESSGTYSADEYFMKITNGGWTRGILIDNNAHTGSFDTRAGLAIDNTGSHSTGLSVYSNQGSEQFYTLVKHKADNTGFDQPVTSIILGGDAGSSSGALYIDDTNANNDNAIYHSSGAVLTHAGVWTDAPCTAEHKFDVQETNATVDANILNIVKSTKTYTYRKKTEEILRVGVMADEIHSSMADPRRKGIPNGYLVGVLFAAVKAQQRQIEELQLRVNFLEGGAA